MCSRGAETLGSGNGEMDDMMVSLGCLYFPLLPWLLAQRLGPCVAQRKGEIANRSVPPLTCWSRDAGERAG